MQGDIEGVLSPIFRCKKASCTTKDEQTSLDFFMEAQEVVLLAPSSFAPDGRRKNGGYIH